MKLECVWLSYKNIEGSSTLSQCRNYGIITGYITKGAFTYAVILKDEALVEISVDKLIEVKEVVNV